MRTLVLIVSIVSAGLVAGLFFGWRVSVIPGLRKISDTNYVATMQSINREIINPAFVVTFLVVPFLLGAAAFGQYRAGNQRRAWYLGAAAVTYVVGVLGVTFGGNIPLNNSLDAFDLGASDDAGVTAMRHNFETPWNRWNNVRTAASAAAFALAAVATTIGEQELVAASYYEA